MNRNSWSHLQGATSCLCKIWIHECLFLIFLPLIFNMQGIFCQKKRYLASPRELSSRLTQEMGKERSPNGFGSRPQKSRARLYFSGLIPDCSYIMSLDGDGIEEAKGMPLKFRVSRLERSRLLLYPPKRTSGRFLCRSKGCFHKS